MNRGMNLILTCLDPLDLTFFSDDELLLTETDLTEQTEHTEIGQLKTMKTLTILLLRTETKTRLRSGIINLLFDDLAYNTSGHFAHCSYFSSPLRASEKY